MKEIFLHYVFARVRANIKSESSRYFFGFLWWLLEPLLLLIVFYFVFGLIFERGGEGYASSLIVGISVWLWFANSIVRSMTSISSSSGIIQQVYCPKVIFPAISLLNDMIKQFVVFFFMLFIIAIMEKPSISWLYFPLLVFVQFFLISSISYFIAGVSPFLPDLRVFVPPSMQMLMFLSGVFYSMAALPVTLSGFLEFNPVAQLIHQYRVVLIHGGTPDILILILILIPSLALLFASLKFISINDRKYPRLSNK